jgi:hypothetical protein
MKVGILYRHNRRERRKIFAHKPLEKLFPRGDVPLCGFRMIEMEDRFLLVALAWSKAF